MKKVYLILTTFLLISLLKIPLLKAQVLDKYHLTTITRQIQSPPEAPSLPAVPLTPQGINCTLTTPVQTPVLVLEYYPRDPNNPNNIDTQETGVTGTIQFWETAINKMVVDHIPFVNDATRFHGYKNQNAQPFLNYLVSDRKKFYEKIPRGHLLKPETNTYRPNYGLILTNQNICNYVDNLGVKEVWMYGYHSLNIEPDESRMSSRYGDISNSWPDEQFVDPQYRMPICNNSYVLYNFAYDPSGNIANPVHNRMHQIESVMGYIDYNLFWNDFSELTFDTTIHNYRSSCGNGHYAPNWRVTSADPDIDDDYNYAITDKRDFNCETWNPDDSKTTYINAGCERWGCTDLGYYKWFMQNLPGVQNGIIYNGQTMRNWWEAMYDFNKFVDDGRTFYGGSILCTSYPPPEPCYPLGNADCVGDINASDLTTFISAFEKTNIPHIDFDRSGKITTPDLSILLGNFRK